MHMLKCLQIAVDDYQHQQGLVSEDFSRIMKVFQLGSDPLNQKPFIPETIWFFGLTN